MKKTIFMVLVMLLFIQAHLSYAQTDEVVKIYSGYLHVAKPKSHGSIWHTMFGPKAPPDQLEKANACSLEFHYPSSIAAQPSVVIPDKIAYYIRFKDLDDKDIPLQKAIEDGNFIVNFYTVNDEEFSFDPNTEGKKVSPRGGHYIHDMYLIYLILGHDINHVIIASTSKEIKDVYLLDQFEINDSN